MLKARNIIFIMSIAYNAVRPQAIINYGYPCLWLESEPHNYMTFEKVMLPKRHERGICTKGPLLETSNNQFLLLNVLVAGALCKYRNHTVYFFKYTLG